jgi:hypothetical protein
MLLRAFAIIANSLEYVVDFSSNIKMVRLRFSWAKKLILMVAL